VSELVTRSVSQSVTQVYTLREPFVCMMLETSLFEAMLTYKLSDVACRLLSCSDSTSSVVKAFDILVRRN